MIVETRPFPSEPLNERYGDLMPMTPLVAREYNWPRMADYWDIVEPVWDIIDIYEGPEVFRRTYNSTPRESRLMFAAHYCQSEVCNGGFAQFFGNSTGVLAPEAVEAFREIGQPQVAALVRSAMDLFGPSYPRDRDEREGRLSGIAGSALDALDKSFFNLIESEEGGFEAAANRYVERMGRRQ